MAFTLDQIVPWGRSFDEYVAMCWVAREVRIFPLLDMSGKRSPHVDPICDCLRKQDYYCGIEEVDYEFQRGGNQVLRVYGKDEGR